MDDSDDYIPGHYKMPLINKENLYIPKPEEIDVTGTETDWHLVHKKIIGLNKIIARKERLKVDEGVIDFDLSKSEPKKLEISKLALKIGKLHHKQYEIYAHRCEIFAMKGRSADNSNNEADLKKVLQEGIEMMLEMKAIILSTDFDEVAKDEESRKKQSLDIDLYFQKNGPKPGEPKEIDVNQKVEEVIEYLEGKDDMADEYEEAYERDIEDNEDIQAILKK